MKKIYTGVIVFLLSVSAGASDLSWNTEQLEVIRFLESLPETYTSGDLIAYMDKYHEGYTNWYMTTDKVQNRAQIAEAVRRSQDTGVRILDFRVTPITIEIDRDKAFVRYIEEEMMPGQNGQEEWSAYHFVATLVRNDGHWQFWRTSFFEAPDSTE